MINWFPQTSPEGIDWFEPPRPQRFWEVCHELEERRKNCPLVQAIRDRMDIWLIQSYYEHTVENYAGDAGDARKAINQPDPTIEWV